jgi:5'-nucleotidase
MRRLYVWVLATAIAVVSACAPAAAQPSVPMHVLVTNDDGVGAEGISALVEHLAAIRGLRIEVVAPATNQSGSGSNFTTTSLEVFPSMTAAGHPATAVRGFPADTVLFGTLSGEFDRPDLVVSGINEGQNIADAVTISGTVGAALTGARLGIPGFAVSQALGAGISYEEAAEYTAGLVERFRSSATFRRLLRSRNGRGRVLNINFPTCTEGSLRGVRTVVVGRSTNVVGYDPAPVPGTWIPEIERMPLGSNDCRSSLRKPLSDIEALNNGFASVTVLNVDLTNEDATSSVRRYVED